MTTRRRGSNRIANANSIARSFFPLSNFLASCNDRKNAKHESAHISFVGISEKRGRRTSHLNMTAANQSDTSYNIIIILCVHLEYLRIGRTRYRAGDVCPSRRANSNLKNRFKHLPNYINVFIRFKYTQHIHIWSLRLLQSCLYDTY